MPKFEIPTIDLPTEAARPLYAGVGVTDVVVGYVRETVADLQKKLSVVQKDVQTRISDFELQPKAFRDQAVVVVNARVDALTEDAKARRAAVEARVAELQKSLDQGVSTVGATYADLAKRGETLIDRIRSQQSTQATKASAATTTAKAKTTKTQATKATKTTAKKASTTAKKSSTTPKSSAKATKTAAKKTASSAVQATADAAAKVGD